MIFVSWTDLLYTVVKMFGLKVVMEIMKRADVCVDQTVTGNHYMQHVPMA